MWCKASVVTLALALQVLNIQQTAEVLVHCDPKTTIVEDLLSHIAEQHGFPTKQEIIAAEPDGPSAADWLRFWDYAEDVNPYVLLRPEYIPIGNSRQPATGSVLLY